MKSSNSLTTLLLACSVAVIAVCVGCKDTETAKVKDTPQNVQAFTGKAPVTQDYKNKVADLMKKQQEWNDKMRKNGAGVPAAPAAVAQ